MGGAYNGAPDRWTSTDDPCNGARMPDQAGTVRLLHWTVRTSWILMLALGACGDAAGPSSPESITGERPVVSVLDLESVDLSDLRDRLLLAVDDALRADKLRRAVDDLSVALEARDYSRARAALTLVHGLAGALEFHPATQTLVTRALDGADTTIERAMPGTVH